MHRLRAVTRGVPLACLLLWAGVSVPETSAQVRTEQLTLLAADSVSVFATLHEPAAAGQHPLIMLFHQGGGSGEAEYAPIWPRLVEDGYAVIISDQRRGGDRFGEPNRTVNALGHNDTPYCDVYPDLEAVLKWAVGTGRYDQIVAWGSSYSATLVLRLAAEHPEAIDGVLSFSPASGGPMTCSPVDYAAEVPVPVAVFRPEREAAIESVAADLESFRAQGHTVFVSVPGSHGSSMLVERRAGGPTDRTWEVVQAHLKRIRASADGRG